MGARSIEEIERNGVRTVDDALVMADAITDPSTGDIEYLHAHGCDVIEQLASEVRSLRRKMDTPW